MAASFSFLLPSLFRASWWTQHIKFQVSLPPQYSKEISWSPLTGWGSLLLMLAHFSGPFCVHPSQSNSFCKQMNFPTLSDVLTTQWTMKFMVSMVIQFHVMHVTVQGVHTDTALCGKGWCEKTKNGNVKLKFIPSPGDLPDPGIIPLSHQGSSIIRRPNSTDYLSMMPSFIFSSVISLPPSP